MKTFVEIDYHKNFSYATMVTEKGKVLKRGRIWNDLQRLRQFLGRYADENCAAVLEAGYKSHVMYDWLDELVDSVTLAHPSKLKAIAEAKVKTDKIDSALLAHFLCCDLIPAAHVSSSQARMGKTVVAAPDVSSQALDDGQKQDSCFGRWFSVAHQRMSSQGIIWIQRDVVVEVPGHTAGSSMDS